MGYFFRGQQTKPKVCQIQHQYYSYPDVCFFNLNGFSQHFDKICVTQLSQG